MTRDDPPADHSEDPRGRDLGAGYPEEQPETAQPGVERDAGSGRDRRDPRRRKDAPAQSRDEDRNPGAATGNPRAAG